MANATFGVNIIPKSNSNTIGNSDHPWTVVSPNMTGTPTAPTAATGTDTTQVATTEFVNDAIAATAPGDATQSTHGLMSATDKAKLDGVAEGATANEGTVQGVKMNNGTAIEPDANGIVDLGTVITAHQDISGKADKSSTVSGVSYDTTNKKITETINGTSSDVVTVAQIKSDIGKFTWGQLAGQSDPT